MSTLARRAIAATSIRFIGLLACGLLIAAVAGAQSYTFTTFAGVGPGSLDGTGSAARFSAPNGIAIDSSGNLYVAESENHTIRRITPAGVVTTVAGLAGVSGSGDGTRSAARFRNPRGLAIDGSGNLYVGDLLNHTIRKITPGGVVTTLAGLAGTFGSADGTGSVARFRNPAGVAVDSTGNVYVGDSSNSTIRKITPGGLVTTLAGLAGATGSTNGTGADARFNSPNGVAIDSSGNLYVADQSNHTIRMITPAAEVTTLAGLANNVGAQNGTGSAARFNNPNGVGTDTSGNVYVADRGHTVRKIAPGAVVTTFAGLAQSPGSADGTGNAARFYSPTDVTTDNAGNVYVAELGNTIRTITPAAAVTTLVGLAGHPGYADGGAIAARFSRPRGVTIDSGGNVYVADQLNNCIRKITPAGAVSTLAGLGGFGGAGSLDGTGTAAKFNNPHGLAADAAGNIYVADQLNHTIRAITSAGVVTTLTGLAGSFGSTDGTLSAARFRNPSSVATDSSGNIYVADQLNHTIRKIAAGEVTTLAGSAGTSGSANGTGTAARFNRPTGVATDSAGNVYVADQLNHTIRKITPAGEVTTLAGQAPTSGSADGTGSAARFNTPTGVAVDSSGNVYVADQTNDTIRRITPAGVVTTLGGLAGFEGSAEGTGSVARFNEPTGVAISSGGILYVADTINNAIRAGNVSLSDVATIDFSTGIVGATRQLDTTPQTATSWQWSLIRRPASSSAELSSSTTRNPVFTPDAADLYTFRLVASNGINSSISTVSLTVTPASSTTTLSSAPNPSLPGQPVTLLATVTSPGGTPTGTVTFKEGETILGSGALDSSGDATYDISSLTVGSHTLHAVYSGDPNFLASTSANAVHTVSAIAAPTGVTATASSPTSVAVSWLASAGAASYEIARSSSGFSFAIIGTSDTTFFSDLVVSANTAYLYVVRAVDSFDNRSAYSNADLATTVMFTDDPLVAQTTSIKGIHLTQLRTAVQAVRALTPALPPASFTDTSINNTVPVKAIHVSELRSALDAARAPLALAALTYTDPTLTAGVTVIKAVHFQQLRAGVK